MLVTYKQNGQTMMPKQVPTAQKGKNDEPKLKWQDNSVAFETHFVVKQKRLRHTGAVCKAGKGFWTLVRIAVFLLIYKQCGAIVVSQKPQKAPIRV